MLKVLSKRYIYIHTYPFNALHAKKESTNKNDNWADPGKRSSLIIKEGLAIQSERDRESN